MTDPEWAEPDLELNCVIICWSLGLPGCHMGLCVNSYQEPPDRSPLTLRSGIKAFVDCCTANPFVETLLIIV